MSWQQFQTIDEVLRFEFERRAQRNPSYSLRAFSRDIGLTPAHLNEIMKGRSGLSEGKAQQILIRIGATDSESDWFRLLVRKDYSRSEQTRKVAKKAIEEMTKSRRKLNPVKRERFRLVSRWYHFAILEMFSLKGFRLTPQTIAARLAISIETATQALNNLQKAEMIEKDSQGRLQLCHSDSAVSSAQPEESIREYHRQVLALALASVDQANEQRELGALTLAVRHADLDEAKRRIREFRQSFNREFGVDRDGDDVYCLSVQLFPFTKPGGSLENE